MTDTSNRPKSRSGLAAFIVFFAVFALGAALVVWLVTQPFRDLASNAEKQAAERKAADRPQPSPGATRAATATVLMSVGSPGSGPGQFDDVRAIAVDGAGRLYASDYQRTGRVQVFDQAGTLVAEWHVSGKYPVTSVAALEDGRVCVVQQGEISVHDAASGKRVGARSVPDGRGFHDVAAVPGGGLAAYGWFDGRDRIVVFDKAGRVVREVRDVVFGRLDEPLLEGQLAVDGSGRAWLLAGMQRPSVLRFAASGAFVGRFEAGRSRREQFNGSAEIAAAAGGRLLITGREGVVVLDGDGTYLETLAVPGQAQARDIAVVDAASAWVSTSNQQVLKVSLPPPAR